jgi:hypothetical protein
MLDAKPIRFPVRIEIRAPQMLSSALEHAAHRSMTSVSEYARRAVLAALRRDGFMDSEQMAS